MGLAWAENLSVGNAMIDAEHKNLIIAINSVEQAIGTRDRVALSNTFDLLETYLRIHFRNEERIAEAVRFSFTQNRLEHQQLLKELKSMREELERMDGFWSDDLANKIYSLMSSWMSDHVMREDMKLKPVLETYPYDFNPD